MKLISICLVAAGILFCVEGKAQVSFKTEYIGTSPYMYMPSGDDKPSVKVGDSKGSAVVYQGMANLPLSMKKNENGQPTVWGVGVGGAYASLKNQNFTDDMVSEIMNLQLGIFHNGKDMMFTHQYIVAGLRPEIKLGKCGLSIHITLVINATRPAFYSNRTFKGMFASNNDYFFRISPYASAGIKFGF